MGTQELNEAGIDGWEAVNVSPWNSPPFVVLMKREISELTVVPEAAKEAGGLFVTDPVPDSATIEPVKKPKGKRNRYET